MCPCFVPRARHIQKVGTCRAAPAFGCSRLAPGSCCLLLACMHARAAGHIGTEGLIELSFHCSLLWRGVLSCVVAPRASCTMRARTPGLLLRQLDSDEPYIYDIVVLTLDAMRRRPWSYRGGHIHVLNTRTYVRLPYTCTCMHAYNAAYLSNQIKPIDAVHVNFWLPADRASR